MSKGNIKVLGLLGLPLLAIAVAVMVFAFNPTTDTTEAANDGASITLSIGGETGKVLVPEKGTFTVSVDAVSIPLTNGYTAVQAWVDFGNTGLVGKKNAQGVWPDLSADTFVSGQAGNAEFGGGLTALSNPPPSFFKGSVITFDVNCDNADPETGAPSSHTITLLALGDPTATTSGTGYVEAVTGTQIPADNVNVSGALVADTIEVNCSFATPTDTPPPTNTPPPIPRMQKCDPDTKTRDEESNVTNNCDSVLNQFLTRQSSKIPPTDCLATPGVIGTVTDPETEEVTEIFGDSNVVGLIENLSQPIVTTSKGELQTIAAFEFDVHYNSEKVCVTLEVGEAFAAAGALCVIEDSNTKAALEGVARIGCLTQGKDHNIDELVAIAGVNIHPQPDMYSEMKPNQDNGNVVQINNVNCGLADEQGEGIPIFACDDADITFRYLEGDVEPDCVVDAIDAQAIAFRWGVTKGSLIYKDFMNLEPSNQQADNDIDINDLQFVFGRFGSTCDAPHPAQDPVNPKA